MGLLIKVVLVAVLAGAVGIVALATIPTPSACTTNAAAQDYKAAWDEFKNAAGPSSTSFREGQLNGALADWRASSGAAVNDLAAHLCQDGTAQLSFTYPVGPLGVKGLVKGTISGSPPTIAVTGVEVGGLPGPLGDLIRSIGQGLIDDLTSVDLSPVDTVVLSPGVVTVTKQ